MPANHSQRLAYVTIYCCPANKPAKEPRVYRKNKKTYESWSDANAHCMSDTRPYHCQHCGKWHIHSRKKGKTRKKKEKFLRELAQRAN